MVEVWDLRRGERLRAFSGHVGVGTLEWPEWPVVRSLACSAKGRSILSGGSDGTVRLWDVDSGEELRSFKGDDRDLRCVAISPDGRRALSAGNDALVRLWDLASGTEVCRLAGHTMGINSVVFSHDGLRALSGSDDGTVRLWQLPEPPAHDGR
jgi:WD40 repeat protein